MADSAEFLHVDVTSLIRLPGVAPRYAMSFNRSSVIASNDNIVLNEPEIDKFTYFRVDAH